MLKTFDRAAYVYFHFECTEELLCKLYYAFMVENGSCHISSIRF